MDFSQLAASLPIERRLALSYAPRGAREPTLGLLALDAALGNLVRAAREPMLGQMRLAWWRDQLGKAPAERPQGEPVLALLAGFPEFGEDLQCLVDGWEVLLGEAPLPPSALAAHAESRGKACAALARALGAAASAEVASRCGQEWALAELAVRLSDPAEHAFAQALVARAGWQSANLPRSLRPLKVLHALALRARGERPLLSRRRDIVSAFRLGLLGI